LFSRFSDARRARLRMTCRSWSVKQVPLRPFQRPRIPKTLPRIVSGAQRMDAAPSGSETLHSTPSFRSTASRSSFFGQGTVWRGGMGSMLPVNLGRNSPVSRS